MVAWRGKRKLVVVTACVAADGCPVFALNTVEVTQQDFENGAHYDLVAEQLAEKDYEKPYLHFDEFEAPDFLIPAVQRYLGLPVSAADPIPTITEEEC